MTRVELDCITMLGTDYALFPHEGKPQFPHGELHDGEHPAEGVRRILKQWTKTAGAPKLELVDFAPRDGALALVFRAVLTDAPTVEITRAKRMELPENVGRLSGKWVEEAVKTSLAYKLTRG